MKMQFLKSYSSKAGKKNRDQKSSIHHVLTTSDGTSATGLRTSAITSVLHSPQPDSTSLLSETLVYQPPTAVTPMPDYSASPRVHQSPAMATAVAAVSADLDHHASFKTLLVMQAKLTPSGVKEIGGKMEAATSYMYGPKADGGYQAEKKPSSGSSDMQPPRTNRAQALRQERNNNRINEEKLMREQLMKQRIMRSHSETSGFSSDMSDDEEGDETGGEPIHARVIPKSLYHKPKITVRDTLSSKFRYLFNRKPTGVNVYFKQTDDKDQKKKPPFVLASKQNCS